MDSKKIDISAKEKLEAADMLMKVFSSVSQQSWEKELIEYCSNNKDINTLYKVSTDNKMEFVIVMDDSTNDAVLDHNSFSFSILDKYESDLSDFMVLDTETSGGIFHMYEKIEKIYTR